MCPGVSKSGSPISRWMTLLPWASSARARTSTSNAPSPEMCAIRCAGVINSGCFPLLFAQVVDLASGEQQPVQDALVLGQHAMRGAHVDADAHHAHLAGAVACDCVGELRPLLAGSVPDHRFCHW